MRTLMACLAIALSSLSCATMPTAPGDRVLVTGVIQDRDGNPVSQAYVYFQQRSSGVLVSGASAVTDANGRYQASLNEGRFDLRIQARGFADAWVRDLKISKDRRRLDYRFAGFWVTGSLTGPGGTLLPGARGIANGSGTGGEVRVSAGTYSILLPAGSYEFLFIAGYVPGLPQIRMTGVPVSRDTTIDIVIDGNLVTGTVTGPGGVPLTGADLTAFSDRASVQATTDINGHYEMRLPTGAYTIRVSPPQALSFIASRQIAASVSQATTLDFDLSGTRWSGFVRLASDSTPVAGARLYATEAGSPTQAWTVSDAAGRFQFVVRTGGFYRIEGFLFEGGYRVIPVGAIAESDSTFDLFLVPGAIPIPIDGPRRPAPRSRAGG